MLVNCRNVSASVQGHGRHRFTRKLPLQARANSSLISLVGNRMLPSPICRVDLRGVGSWVQSVRLQDILKGLSLDMMSAFNPRIPTCLPGCTSAILAPVRWPGLALAAMRARARTACTIVGTLAERGRHGCGLSVNSVLWWCRAREGHGVGETQHAKCASQTKVPLHDACRARGCAGMTGSPAHGSQAPSHLQALVALCIGHETPRCSPAGGMLCMTGMEFASVFAAVASLRVGSCVA